MCVVGACIVCIVAFVVCINTCSRQNERILIVMELQTMDNLKFSASTLHLLEGF